MSLTNWFSNKTLDAKVPDVVSPNTAGLATAGNLLDSTIARKAERLKRREELYGVVRDAMTRAGILSASYKFKVLSLDPRGGQYLVMMDLANQAAGDTGRLAEIEALIAQNAKIRHEILVTAVYWRVNEYVATGTTTRRHVSALAPDLKAQVPRHGGVEIDDLMAFKNALAPSAHTGTRVASGEIIKTGRRNPLPAPSSGSASAPEEGEERASPLSNTQYGDLN